MSDFVVADSDAELLLSLVHRDGSIFDMTDKTAKIAWRIGDGTAFVQSMEVLSPATDGRVRYRFVTGAQIDLYASGMLYVEVHVLDAALKPVSSAEILQFTVRDAIGF